MPEPTVPHARTLWGSAKPSAHRLRPRAAGAGASTSLPSPATTKILPGAPRVEPWPCTRIGPYERYALEARDRRHGTPVIVAANTATACETTRLPAAGDRGDVQLFSLFSLFSLEGPCLGRSF